MSKDTTGFEQQPRCSFCGERQSSNTRMIKGPGVYICEECVNVCKELMDGPFRHLHGRWAFTPLRDDACKVSLELDFEFSGALIDRAFGPVFNQVANTLVDAFCKRADEVDGA